MWPVHTWLPDAHVEAPTAGSVILAAILLKMAGYGFIRFSLGLFPVASELFTPLVYIIKFNCNCLHIFSCINARRYEKINCLFFCCTYGFCNFRNFYITQQGIEGSIIQMISHGLVSAALFLCVGVVYDRMHSSLIKTYGGLVSVMPKYSILFMLVYFSCIRITWNKWFYR